ncbi:hypothetical protein A0J61_09951 [Choanephora cucurbitarum]|uniref:Uncharacterized protein n=1 Tax=Choanephora cucurbitarum TaxID=101091 RepID=A0A1C7MYS6_9FUNG|nr:hypothetical protein A0J61_09951 [Choanephora cucurbitarum]
MRLSISTLLVLTITNVASSLPKVSKSYSVLADSFGSVWISTPECDFSVNRYSFRGTLYLHEPRSSCPPGSSTLIIYFIEQDDIVPNRVIDIDLDDVYRCFRIPATTTTTNTTTPALTYSNKGTFYNKKRGNSMHGDCFKDQSDCINQCIRGKCNGPVRCTKIITTTIAKPTKTSSTCKAGFRGLKNGKGRKDACCTTHWDCKEQCIEGRCN